MNEVLENRKRMIDRAEQLDIAIKLQAAELNGIKAVLQAEALAVMENTNTKYVEFWGSKASVFVAYKEKFEIDNLPYLEEIFGQVLEGKITKEESIKITLDSKLKKAIMAIYSGKYANNDIPDMLKKHGMGDKEAKAVGKKLKGDYGKDLKTLRSFGLASKDGAEEELDCIMEAKNYQLIRKFIDPEQIDIEKLRRAVSVEESLAIGLVYDMEGRNESEDDRAEAD